MWRCGHSETRCALIWHWAGCVRLLLEPLWRDQGGASLIDYAILVAVICDRRRARSPLAT
jgi:hypothetical protein